MLVATLSFRSIILIHDTKKKWIHTKNYNNRSPIWRVVSRYQSVYKPKTYIVYFCLQSQRWFITNIFTLISSMTYRIGIKSTSRRKPEYKTEIRKKSFQILFRSCQLNISLSKYRVHIYSCLRHLIQTISMARPCKLNVVYCSLMNLYTRCNWSTSLVLEMSLTTIYRKLPWYRQIPYYNLAGTICLCKWTIACISHILLKKSIIHSIVWHYWYSTVSRIDDDNLW